MIERLDALFAAGDCPDAIVVFVDAWTSFGGSQFLNSTGTGRYLDYLCDEVVAFVDERYPTAAEPRPPRPDRQVQRRLRRDGRADAAPRRLRRARLARRRRALRDLLPAGVPEGRADAARRSSTARGTCSSSAPAQADPPHYEWIELLEAYGYAAVLLAGPGATRAARCCRSTSTAGSIDDVWAQWLRKDPVRMAPFHADALRSMRRIYLDAGRGDEYFLDLGAPGLRGRARQARRRAHARALRRHARAPHVPLPGRDPGAGARYRAVSGNVPSRAQASTAGHEPYPASGLMCPWPGSTSAGPA